MIEPYLDVSLSNFYLGENQVLVHWARLICVVSHQIFSVLVSLNGVAQGHMKGRFLNTLIGVNLLSYCHQADWTHSFEFKGNKERMREEVPWNEYKDHAGAETPYSRDDEAFHEELTDESGRLSIVWIMSLLFPLAEKHMGCEETSWKPSHGSRSASPLLEAGRWYLMRKDGLRETWVFSQSKFSPSESFTSWRLFLFLVISGNATESWDAHPTVINAGWSMEVGSTSLFCCVSSWNSWPCGNAPPVLSFGSLCLRKAFSKRREEIWGKYLTVTHLNIDFVDLHFILLNVSNFTVCSELSHLCGQLAAAFLSITLGYL